MVNRTVVMVVDPTTCDGHGVCAEIFPERVSLDRWGYPIVDNSDIPPDLRDHALRAVNSCPRLALHLMEVRRLSDRVGRQVPDRTQ
ncbi:MAG: ferredoxin [Acidimicrobiales bacterium]